MSLRRFGCPILVLLFIGPGEVQAQEEHSTVLKFERNKGVRILQDPVFSMTFRFRMQNRAWAFSETGNDLSPAVTDMRIRRMRLRLEGHVLSPRLMYKVQLGFSRADLDLIESDVAQPIRDAMVYYRPSEQWLFGFGQTKVPGNRQRVVSSGALQLPDRSVVNGMFTLDRDFGAFAEWHGHLREQHVRLKGSITTGEGRNAPPGNEGLCYTGRLEWLPLGEFKNDGDYFEGDLEHEESPRLSFGAGASTNQMAARAGGQLGPEFAGNEHRTLNIFMVDALFKYRGLAVTSELIQRVVEGDPMTTDGAGAFVTAYEGWGWNSQASRMFGEHWELVSRYSMIRPSTRLKDVKRQLDEVWLGGSYYMNHHRIKFQGSMAYFWQDDVPDLDHSGNRWGLMFQVEFGI